MMKVLALALLVALDIYLIWIGAGLSHYWLAAISAVGGVVFMWSRDRVTGWCMVALAVALCLP